MQQIENHLELALDTLTDLLIGMIHVIPQWLTMPSGDNLNVKSLFTLNKSNYGNNKYYAFMCTVTHVNASCITL